MKRARRIALALLLFEAIAILILGLLGRNAVAAAARTDAWPLQHGTTAKTSSRGPRVAELQFLIRNPRPKANAWTKITGTLKPGTFTKGIYDLSTAKAVIAWKFRVGFPARGQCGSKVDEWRQTKVTEWFAHLLLTDKGRPYCWVAVAAKRIAAAEGSETPLAKKLADYELAQINSGRFYETCGGSCNRGPAIDAMERVFGLIGQPWCAIAQNYSLRAIGQPLLPAAYNNPFYVPNLITAGMEHLKGSSLQAIARPGEWVLYYHDISHTGYVVKIDKGKNGKPNGYYWTYEGNWNDHWAMVHHSPYDHLHYFLAVPKFVVLTK